MKYGTGQFAWLSENKAIVIVHDFSAQGKTNSGPWISFVTVQPLKDLEYFFFVPVIKADTIVGKKDLEVIKLWLEFRIFQRLQLRKFSWTDRNDRMIFDRTEL